MRQAPKENRNHNGDEHSNGHVCDNYLPLGPVLNKHLASITTAVPSPLALEPVPQFLPPPFPAPSGDHPASAVHLRLERKPPEGRGLCLLCVSSTYNAGHTATA